MTSGTHEHLEHAEHAHHAAASGGFPTTVAMTMSIIAALLAVVTLLSHRAHNETIVLEARAAALQAEAGILRTRESDAWSRYQAKRIRATQYRGWLAMLPVIAKDESDPRVAELKMRWQADCDRYEGDGKGELKDIEREATELAKLAEAKARESVAAITASEETHRRGDRYDAGELLVEIGLVLCSVAMLVKRRSLLVLAVVLALAGVAVAGTAFMGLKLGGSPGAAGEKEKGAEKGEKIDFDARIAEARKKYAAAKTVAQEGIVKEGEAGVAPLVEAYKLLCESHDMLEGVRKDLKRLESSKTTSASTGYAFDEDDVQVNMLKVSIRKSLKERPGGEEALKTLTPK